MSKTNTSDINITFDENDVLSNGGYNNKMMKMSTVSGNQLKGYECSLTNLYVNYSFPTFMTASYFTYTIPETSTDPATVFNVPIPADTTMEIATFNALMESVMITNGHYLKDADNNNVYYASMTANSVYYRMTLQCPVMPLVLPVGWTDPTGLFPFPLVANSNIIITYVEPQVLRYTGFDAGLYPTTAVITGGDYIVNGARAPQVSPYSSISVRVNCCSNINYTNPDQIYSFPIDVPYGQVIKVEPKFQLWNDTNETVSFTQFTLELRDGVGNPLKVLDPQWTANVKLRRKEMDLYTLYNGLLGLFKTIDQNLKNVDQTLKLLKR